MDGLADQRIICEYKALAIVNPIGQAQVLIHLKLTGLEVAFIINFKNA
jgi:GxxExxY protein